MVIAKYIRRFGLQSILLLCLPLLALLPVSTAHAMLTASVDRTHISENDIIELSVRSDQGQLEQADFSELEKDFVVLNQRRSNQISIINGRREANYDLTLALAPKRAGSLTIPAFTSQGERSQPIAIEVSTHSATPSASREEIFLATQISKQEVYVQEQLLYTLRLFHAVGLSEAQLTPLTVENAVIKPIGDQHKYETLLAGIRYSVIERQYSVIPERSGTLTLPEQVFTGRAMTNPTITNRSSYNSYARPGQYIRTRSEAHVINVLPKPANYPASQPWLPTPELQIEDSWNTHLPTFKVGEPVTRTLTLSARNLSAAQLPDLTLPASDGLKMYPDQPQNEDSVNSNGLLGQRNFSTAIVPSRAGTLELAPIRVVWWNTDSKQLEHTTLAAQTIEVMPAAQPANASQPLNIPREPSPALPGAVPQPTGFSSAGTSAGRGIWPLLSLILALLWVGTLVMWWRARSATGSGHAPLMQAGQTGENARSAYKVFNKAALNNDAKGARESLIIWCQLQHTGQPVHTLTDVSQLYQDPELTRLIDQLERHLYGSAQPNASWHGSDLLKCIEGLRKTSKAASTTPQNQLLKPLYPL